jgi:stearoyl-CoA desaturase (Delta-9 desaturase)
MERKVRRLRLASQATSLRPPRHFNLGVLTLYLGIHLGCLGVLATGVTWEGVRICLFAFLIRSFGLGAGYHRYFAHKSFQTSRAMQFILGLLGTLALEGGPLWWADTHRRHHRYADTPEDIHSPTYQGFIYAHSGWFLDKANSHTDLSSVPDLAKYPEMLWLDQLWGYMFLPVICAFILFWQFGWTGFVWGVCVSSVLIWHATHWIQSLSHSYGGYRRFASADNSRNHWFVAMITFGEWHNNHHHFPWSARQGLAWWEIDIVYAILKFMSWMGLIWDLKTAKKARTAVVQG